MDWVEWIKGLDAAAGILAVFISTIGGTVIWYVRSRRGISSEITAAAGAAAIAPVPRVERLESRMTRVEDRLQNTATRDDVEKVREDVQHMQIGITEIKGGLETHTAHDKALQQQLTGVSRQIEMLTEAKLREGREG